jgi:hypothetical protein
VTLQVKFTESGAFPLGGLGMIETVRASAGGGGGEGGGVVVVGGGIRINAAIIPAATAAALPTPIISSCSFDSSGSCC